MPDGTTAWSEKAEDWAEVMEGWDGWGLPVYRHVLERVPVGGGDRVLDVGCGAGRFCRVAADRGAEVAGLDATEAFARIARRRVAAGDFRVGDMLALPWPEDSFDLVTGFNSFFLADDMVAALAEAGRVARRGAAVATSVFGRPECCRSTAVFEAMGALLGDGGGGGPTGPGLHEVGVLEERFAGAGLSVESAEYVPVVERYPDLDTLLRGYLAAPPGRRAVAAAGEAAVREAIAGALGELRGPDGSYALEEEVRCVIGRA